MHEFDFGFVTNETFNTLRPVFAKNKVAGQYRSLFLIEYIPPPPLQPSPRVFKDSTHALQDNFILLCKE
jgi:hypothetical protein